MNKDQLFEQIKKKKSFLCVGLDTDYLKIGHLYPGYSRGDAVFAYNVEIIKATNQYAVAYKPNLAFYESLGSEGWQALEKTADYVKINHPELFLIADAKRGDIGNTSNLYARAIFEQHSFDAVTVAPYMGEDSVKPFLGYQERWVILLALTSNKGAFDFQYLQDKDSEDRLFERVLQVSKTWGSEENMMYVVGATKAEELAVIRDIVPDHFLLVPGVGAQGGSLEEVAKYGLNKQCGLLVNSSRSIIFASKAADFAEKAGAAAKEVQIEMARLLWNANIA